MELGLFTSGYQRYPLEQAFEDASRFGYDYIELWGGYPHAYVEDLTARGGGEIDRLIQKYRMPVKCFTPEHNGYPFNYMAGDEFQWERSMVYLEKAIELTAAMGAPMMLFSAGHAGYQMGMCDLAVPYTTGEPAAEYVRRLGGRFGYLHVIDNDGVSDSHILPGDGNMPLEGILREIRRAGYDGCATIELVTGYLKEPSVYAEIAIKRIRSIL